MYGNIQNYPQFAIASVHSLPVVFWVFVFLETELMLKMLKMETGVLNTCSKYSAHVTKE